MAGDMIGECLRCLDRTAAFIRASVADLADDEMTLQPAGAPNHPAWTLGHVVYSWQAIMQELGVSPWLPDDWESFFGYGTSPANVVCSAYSSRTLLTASLADAVNRMRAALLDAEEDALNEPLSDADSRQVFSTTGDALLQVVVAHSAFHAGQLAAWRRAAGREPAGVFI